MIDHFRDWHTQIASVALSIVTSYLLSTFKTDTEREDFTIKMLSDSQFVYKTGDILKAVGS